jgi:hypothetical protein
VIKMGLGALAAALLFASGVSAAPAQGARSADGAARNASTGQSKVMVYVCDRSDETRRAFEREYGAQEFVTADSIQRVSDTATPKCMTAAELRRYKDRAGR